jgi:hypothetical protein
MYKIYLRSHNGRVSPDDRWIEPTPQLAEARFRELMWRRDLWGTRTSVVLSLDNQVLDSRRFDRMTGATDHDTDELRSGNRKSRPKALAGFDSLAEFDAQYGPGGYMTVIFNRRVADAPCMSPSDPVMMDVIHAA